MKIEVELTKRQEEILGFIKTHIEKSGYPPTVSEIQEEFSFKSPNAVQEHVKALERKGYIRRSPNQWRGLEIVNFERNRNEVSPSSMVSVPLVGHIAAGTPVLAEENIEGTISVDRFLVPHSAILFALRVHGDSMIKAAICDGDIVIARQQSIAQNGDIVIALFGDEATVKRFRQSGKTVVLQPENDTMHPIYISQREDFRVLGKVVATMRKF